jgi:hypothetical protein
MTQVAAADLVPSNSGQTWTNSSPIPVSFNAVGSRVGVRISLSGNTTAGSACAPPTLCFDSTSPNNGLWMIHTWDNPSGTVGLPTGQGNNPVGPVVREAWVTPAAVTGCPDGSFSATSAACSVVFHANLVFAAGDQCDATGNSPVIVKLTTAGGTASGPTRLTCPTGVGGSASGEWTSSAISINPNSGPTTFQVDYTLQSGEQKPAGASGGTNTNTNNPISFCQSTGNTSCSNNGAQNGFGSVAQRIFMGSPDLSSSTSSRSGTISGLSVTDSSTGQELAQGSVQRCTGASTCSKSFNITVTVFPLTASNDLTSAAINLRSADPQGNGAIDCGQGNGASAYQTALVNGCPTTLAKAPAGSTSSVCASAPNECVGVVPGNGKVTDSLDARIACQQGCSTGDGSVGQGSIPSTKCDNPNFWTVPNDLSLMKSRLPADPRLVQLIIVPYGSLSSTGSYQVPIQDFASFYVTGYDSNGSQKTCQSTGAYTSASSSFAFLADTLTSGGNNNHEVWGHFVVFTEPSGGGTGGGGTCDPNVASDCIAVLTK